MFWKGAKQRVECFGRVACLYCIVNPVVLNISVQDKALTANIRVYNCVSC